MSLCLSWLVCFFPTWYNLESPGSKEPKLRNCLSQASGWRSLWSIFLIGDWWRKTQPLVGDVILGQGVLGVYESKLSDVVISIASQPPASFCSCLQGPPSLTSWPDFSPWWSVNSDGINPFLSKILFVMVFLAVIESQLEWYLSYFFSNYYKLKKNILVGCSKTHDGLDLV